MNFNVLGIKRSKKLPTRLASKFLSYTPLMMNRIHYCLHIAVLLLALFLIQSCSSFNHQNSREKDINKITKKKKGRLPPSYENFDKKPFPNESFVIANMIAIVKPDLDEDERDEIAVQISKAIKKHKVEPQIMVAIIDTESDFQADKISSTGDVSLAQINVEVWSKEFCRIKRKPIIKERLIADQEYALTKMAEILVIIKQRFAHKDRRWYARYHSNTTLYKKEYLHKLEIRLNMLAKSRTLETKLAERD
jgi:hypothetical protein